MTHTSSLAKIAAVFVVVASAQPAASQTLTVAWYGGNWGDAFQTCVADPFTKATGVKVIPEIGTSTTTLSKLQQQKGEPSIDAAWMDGGISELAEAAGVLDDLDARAIPNLGNVMDSAIYKQGGHIFAVGTGYYSLGLVYNTQQVKQAPTSWNDLWKPEFADASMIPSPANSAGVPFLFFLRSVWNLPHDEDFSQTFQKLKQLKTSLYYDSSGTASNSLQSGEAVIGAHFNAAAWDLIDKGLPIAFVVPKEGVWATDARLHLMKGTPKKALAEKFINTALTPEASGCLAQKLYLGPSVKNVAVSPDTAKKLPWGEHGSVKDLRLFDWTEINKERPKIVDMWNREIAHQ